MSKLRDLINKFSGNGGKAQPANIPDTIILKQLNKAGPTKTIGKGSAEDLILKITENLKELLEIYDYEEVIRDTEILVFIKRDADFNEKLKAALKEVVKKIPSPDRSPVPYRVQDGKEYFYISRGTEPVKKADRNFLQFLKKFDTALLSEVKKALDEEEEKKLPKKRRVPVKTDDLPTSQQLCHNLAEAYRLQMETTSGEDSAKTITVTAKTGNYSIVSAEKENKRVSEQKLNDFILDESGFDIGKKRGTNSVTSKYLESNAAKLDESVKKEYQNDQNTLVILHKVNGKKSALVPGSTEDEKRLNDFLEKKIKSLTEQPEKTENELKPKEAELELKAAAERVVKPNTGISNLFNGQSGSDGATEEVKGGKNTEGTIDGDAAKKNESRISSLSNPQFNAQQKEEDNRGSIFDMARRTSNAFAGGFLKIFNLESEEQRKENELKENELKEEVSKNLNDLYGQGYNELKCEWLENNTNQQGFHITCENETVIYWVMGNQELKGFRLVVVNFKEGFSPQEKPVLSIRKEGTKDNIQIDSLDALREFNQVLTDALAEALASKNRVDDVNKSESEEETKTSLEYAPEFSEFSLKRDSIAIEKMNKEWAKIHGAESEKKSQKLPDTILAQINQNLSQIFLGNGVTVERKGDLFVVASGAKSEEEIKSDNLLSSWNEKIGSQKNRVILIEDNNQLYCYFKPISNADFPIPIAENNLDLLLQDIAAFKEYPEALSNSLKDDTSQEEKLSKDNSFKIVNEQPANPDLVKDALVEGGLDLEEITIADNPNNPDINVSFLINAGNDAGALADQINGLIPGAAVRCNAMGEELKADNSYIRLRSYRNILGTDTDQLQNVKTPAQAEKLIDDHTAARLLRKHLGSYPKELDKIKYPLREKDRVVLGYFKRVVCRGGNFVIDRIPVDNFDPKHPKYVLPYEVIWAINGMMVSGKILAAVACDENGDENGDPQNFVKLLDEYGIGLKVQGDLTTKKNPLGSMSQINRFITVAKTVVNFRALAPILKIPQIAGARYDGSRLTIPIHKESDNSGDELARQIKATLLELHYTVVGQEVESNADTITIAFINPEELQVLSDRLKTTGLARQAAVKNALVEGLVLNAGIKIYLPVGGKLWNRTFTEKNITIAYNEEDPEVSGSFLINAGDNAKVLADQINSLIPGAAVRCDANGEEKNGNGTFIRLRSYVPGTNPNDPHVLQNLKTEAQAQKLIEDLIIKDLKLSFSKPNKERDQSSSGGDNKLHLLEQRIEEIKTETRELFKGFKNSVEAIAEELKRRETIAALAQEVANFFEGKVQLVLKEEEEVKGLEPARQSLENFIKSINDFAASKEKYVESQFKESFVDVVNKMYGAGIRFEAGSEDEEVARILEKINQTFKGPTFWDRLDENAVNFLQDLDPNLNKDDELRWPAYLMFQGLREKLIERLDEVADGYQNREFYQLKYEVESLLLTSGVEANLNPQVRDLNTVAGDLPAISKGNPAQFLFKALKAVGVDLDKIRDLLLNFLELKYDPENYDIAEHQNLLIKLVQELGEDEDKEIQKKFLQILTFANKSNAYAANHPLLEMINCNQKVENRYSNKKSSETKVDVQFNSKSVRFFISQEITNPNDQLGAVKSVAVLNLETGDISVEDQKFWLEKDSVPDLDKMPFYEPLETVNEQPAKPSFLRSFFVQKSKIGIISNEQEQEAREKRVEKIRAQWLKDFQLQSNENQQKAAETRSEEEVSENLSYEEEKENSEDKSAEDEKSDLDIESNDDEKALNEQELNRRYVAPFINLAPILHLPQIAGASYDGTMLTIPAPNNPKPGDDERAAELVRQINGAGIENVPVQRNLFGNTITLEINPAELEVLSARLKATELARQAAVKTALVDLKNNDRIADHLPKTLSVEDRTYSFSVRDITIADNPNNPGINGSFLINAGGHAKRLCKEINRLIPGAAVRRDEGGNVANNGTFVFLRSYNDIAGKQKSKFRNLKTQAQAEKLINDLTAAKALRNLHLHTQQVQGRTPLRDEDDDNFLRYFAATKCRGGRFVIDPNNDQIANVDVDDDAEQPLNAAQLVAQINRRLGNNAAVACDRNGVVQEGVENAFVKLRNPQTGRDIRNLGQAQDFVAQAKAIANFRALTPILHLPQIAGASYGGNPLTLTIPAPANGHPAPNNEVRAGDAERAAELERQINAAIAAAGIENVLVQRNMPGNTITLVINPAELEALSAQLKATELARQTRVKTALVDLKNNGTGISTHLPKTLVSVGNLPNSFAPENITIANNEANPDINGSFLINAGDRVEELARQINLLIPEINARQGGAAIRCYADGEEGDGSGTFIRLRSYVPGQNLDDPHVLQNLKTEAQAQKLIADLTAAKALRDLYLHPGQVQNRTPLRPEDNNDFLRYFAATQCRGGRFVIDPNGQIANAIGQNVVALNAAALVVQINRRLGNNAAVACDVNGDEDGDPKNFVKLRNPQNGQDLQIADGENPQLQIQAFVAQAKAIANFRALTPILHLSQIEGARYDGATLTIPALGNQPADNERAAELERQINAAAGVNGANLGLANAVNNANTITLNIDPAQLEALSVQLKATELARQAAVKTALVDLKNNSTGISTHLPKSGVAGVLGFTAENITIANNVDPNINGSFLIKVNYANAGRLCEQINRSILSNDDPVTFAAVRCDGDGREDGRTGSYVRLRSYTNGRGDDHLREVKTREQVRRLLRDLSITKELQELGQYQGRNQTPLRQEDRDNFLNYFDHTKSCRDRVFVIDMPSEVVVADEIVARINERLGNNAAVACDVNGDENGDPKNFVKLKNPDGQDISTPAQAQAFVTRAKAIANFRALEKTLHLPQIAGASYGGNPLTLTIPAPANGHPAPNNEVLAGDDERAAELVRQINGAGIENVPVQRNLFGNTITLNITPAELEVLSARLKANELARQAAVKTALVDLKNNGTGISAHLPKTLVSVGNLPNSFAPENITIANNEANPDINGSFLINAGDRVEELARQINLLIPEINARQGGAAIRCYADGEEGDGSGTFIRLRSYVPGADPKDPHVLQNLKTQAQAEKLINDLTAAKALQDLGQHPDQVLTNLKHSLTTLDSETLIYFDAAQCRGGKFVIEASKVFDAAELCKRINEMMYDPQNAGTHPVAIACDANGVIDGNAVNNTFVKLCNPDGADIATLDQAQAFVTQAKAIANFRALTPILHLPQIEGARYDGRILRIPSVGTDEASKARANDLLEKIRAAGQKNAAIGHYGEIVITDINPTQLEALSVQLKKNELKRVSEVESVLQSGFSTPLSFSRVENDHDSDLDGTFLVEGDADFVNRINDLIPGAAVLCKVDGSVGGDLAKNTYAKLQSYNEKGELENLKTQAQAEKLVADFRAAESLKGLHELTDSRRASDVKVLKYFEHVKCRGGNFVIDQVSGISADTIVQQINEMVGDEVAVRCDEKGGDDPEGTFVKLKDVGGTDLESSRVKQRLLPDVVNEKIKTFIDRVEVVTKFRALADSLGIPQLADARYVKEGEIEINFLDKEAAEEALEQINKAIKESRGFGGNLFYKGEKKLFSENKHSTRAELDSSGKKITITFDSEKKIERLKKITHRVREQESEEEKKEFRKSIEMKGGDSELHHYSRLGNLEFVKHIIDNKKVEINDKNKVKITEAAGVSKETDDKTSLHLAAENGHEKVVKLLIEKGADPKIKDSKNKTPLELAAAKGRKEAVNVLLNSDKKSELKLSPALLSADSGSKAISSNQERENCEDVAKEIRNEITLRAKYFFKNHGVENCYKFETNSRNELVISATGLSGSFLKVLSKKLNNDLKITKDLQGLDELVISNDKIDGVLEKIRDEDFKSNRSEEEKKPISWTKKVEGSASRRGQSRDGGK